MISFEMITYPRVKLIGNEIGYSSWCLPKNRIEDYQLVIIYHGTVKYTRNNKTYILQSGDYIVVCPGDYYSAEALGNSGMKYYFIHFSIDSAVEHYSNSEIAAYVASTFESLSSEMSQCFWDLSKMFTRRIFLPETGNFGDNFGDTAVLIEKALYEKNKPSLNNYLMVSLYIGQVFVLASRTAIENLTINMKKISESKIPNLVQQIVDYIYGNYRLNLSVSEIAEKFCISQQYISRLFNKHFGKSVKEYINNVRINRAKELLKTSSLSVKEVSFAIGINDPLYFSRLFKKLVGVPPSEYI